MFFDVETKPIKVYTWHLGTKVNLTHDQIVDKDCFDIICIAYKWRHEKKVHALDWGTKQDSTKMLEKFSKIYAQANVVVAQNGDRFDIKHLQTQRLLKGQPPLAWASTEDTLKQSKKHFLLPSYKLDYIGKLLLGKQKVKMVFQDWVDVLNNKPGALKKMVDYCKQDVLLLQEVYEKFSPYVIHSVNYALLRKGCRYVDCPACGKAAGIKNGQNITKAGRYQRYVCRECGHSYRDRRIMVDKR